MVSPKHPREKTLLATIFLLNGIEFLHAGMIAFGAGPIMGHIGASPEEFTLATVVYAVVAVATISQQRWLVERMGWRGFILGSVAVFVAGAAICGGSDGFGQFLFGRAVMGLGGAAFMTSARVLITLMPPTPRRFVGIKVFATALALGNALAPWLAGEMVTRDQWRMIFGILGIAAVTAAGFATLCLPTERAPREQRSGGHPLAMLALVGGCSLTLYALQRATYDFYHDALPLLAAFAAGSALLWYFVHHQRRQAHPLLVLARLGQPRYLAGLALFTLCYMVLGANNYMLPVLTQRALGFSWQVAGMVQGAGLLAALVAFWTMASIMPKDPSPKKFYVAGFVLLAACGGLLTRLNGDADLWRDVFPAIAGYGAFIILVMATTALQAFTGLQNDAQAFSHGQQLKNMMSQFGIAAGVAGAALSLQWRSGEHYTALTARFSPGDAAFAEAAGQLTSALSASHGAQAAQLAVGQLAQQLIQQATLLASLDYFAFLLVLSLIGAVTMLAQRVLK
jgi:MFS family permease